ncbi:MAG: amidophosphoribosyltransferase [Holdemanella sp.]|nr:amidophosphoribosyltransferase [Holdemanella sp.]
MSIHEECGVFGIYSTEKIDIANMCYYGLYALQHRGQESCGIVTNKDGIFHTYKDLGQVNEVFTNDILNQFEECNMGVGHVRYGTTGANTMNNVQPIEVYHRKGKMAIAHNGNISNALQLRDELEMNGAIFHSTSDTETIAYMITKSRLHTPSIEEAVLDVIKDLEGAFSLVIMSAQKLIAVRDPHGFRPLCYGKIDNGYVIASESCALHAVGATFVRDLEPGEMLIFSKEGIKVDKRYCNTKKKHTCIFEYIYFARSDSMIDSISVHDARINAGKILAKYDTVDVDYVIGVPDSGLEAALGYSQAKGIPYEIGLIKNKYIGRTFISPNNRSDKVRIKLNPVESVIKDKKIILIDDSIVRGTTSKHIVSLLREAGAKEIHMRISSPPFLHPCYYGTDIDSEEHLIANKHTVEAIAKIIGVDSLLFLPKEELVNLVHTDTICSSCFDGDYPTTVYKDTRKDRFENSL